MSTMYRLKAYFGMVPPEDMQAYADAYGYDDPDYDGHRSDIHTDTRSDIHERPRYETSHRESRRNDREAPDQHGRLSDERSSDTAAASRSARGTGPQRLRHESRSAPEPIQVGASSGSSRSSHRSPAVHGSLAVDTTSSAVGVPSPAIEPLASLSEPGGVALSSLPLSRITTVHPRSYNEARTIGERYRDGIPVIINLTELDDAAAKRLVDFAAGLAFALRGSIDKVTSRVFLLSPAGVDVSAEERRKLAESGFFGQD
jgi:cell division inhibitor SepF